MAILSYNGVGITAMAGAVPKQVIDNYKYTEFFPEDQVKAVVDKVGVFERRFADKNTCSSDLCFAAADKLHDGAVGINLFVALVGGGMCYIGVVCGMVVGE